jgi:hypothetical protein
MQRGLALFIVLVGLAAIAVWRVASAGVGSEGASIHSHRAEAHASQGSTKRISVEVPAGGTVNVEVP